jgi:flagellar assembly protein FliH
MGTPAKFLFDLDFSSPETARPRPVTPAEIARQIADAEARSYRAGFDAARREVQAENERRTALAFEQIAVAIQGIAASLPGIERRMETEALDVALAVARKLAGELLAAEPLAGIAALVADCFRHLTATPHLVIRVNDQLYERARERFELLAGQSGFQGRLIVIAEPDIESGDCRIEWADGGVVRERAAIDAKIAELVRNYLASRDQTGMGIQS